jgi:hypothetical protein
MDQGALVVENDHRLAEPVKHLDPPTTQGIPIISCHA